MILVDTTVLSEPMKPLPDLPVLTWLDRQNVDHLFFASTSLAELLTRISILPDGQRRQDKMDDVEDLIGRYFGDGILPYDERAARFYARLYAAAHANGVAISMPAVQIAAIAETNGLIVATRDVKPFRSVGLRVINPWQEA